MSAPPLRTTTKTAVPLNVSQATSAPISLILFLSDLVAIGGAGLLSFWVRNLFGNVTPDPYVTLAPLLLLLPVSYLAQGLYPGYGINPVEQLRRISRSTTIVFLFVMALTYLFKVGTVHSRVIITGAWLGILVLVPLTRALLRTILAQSPWWGTPVLVLGAAQTAQVVIQRLYKQPGLGLRPIACLDDDQLKHGENVSGIPVVGPLTMATELAQRHRIQVAVVAMPGLSRQRITAVMEEHAAFFPRVLLIPDLLGVTSLWVTARDLDGVLGLELKQNLLSRWNRLLKRSVDLLVTVPALLVFGPLILLLGGMVKTFSPGPAFYSQAREGLNGKVIRVWKLRTMVPHAENALQSYLAGNPAAKQEWEQFMKLRHDPRIVPVVGPFLRRLSLDELPQLWNIVRGDMSLVGPRPFPEYHLAKFDPRFRSLRCRVTPGLTGLWQVSARSNGDLTVQEELDTYYIRNWSPWLDLYLLARTVAAVLFGSGAY